VLAQRNSHLPINYTSLPSGVFTSSGKSALRSIRY